MFRVIIVGEANKQLVNLSAGLFELGFTCTIIGDNGDAVERIAEQNPELVIIIAYKPSTVSSIKDKVNDIKRSRQVTVIILLSKENLKIFDSSINIDDFVLEPWDVDEMATRAKRALRRNGNIDSDEVIKCGDLVIDVAKCEVFIGGRSVILTFKEFELLRFLATNPGRVFTRDALLNKVWGYDYFGGDRTVDVHIRRLRSKIEDPTHSFIDTVRNIGYKFKEEP